MWIAETIDDARKQRATLPGRVCLVPTMGALHEAHLSLVEEAGRLADHVVVSIFVNPAQFGPDEDLERYPKPLESDLDLCRKHRVAGAFCPTVQQMYPPGGPECRVDVPSLARDLEGRQRPGHFAGVCRVVVKLLNILQPQLSCFGEKDFQQLRVVEALVRDLCMPVEIVPCPIIRDDDGLALSSRNHYLTDSTRPRATALYKALTRAGTLVEQDGETDPGVVEQAMGRILERSEVAIDYAVVRDATTLAPLDCVEPRTRGVAVALVAGSVDGVRLIDNMRLSGAGRQRVTGNG
jgi:pantoate--beta-alanine ligase